MIKGGIGDDDVKPFFIRIGQEIPLMHTIRELIDLGIFFGVLAKCPLLFDPFHTHCIVAPYQKPQYPAACSNIK